jgi:hypothetical protein
MTAEWWNLPPQEKAYWEGITNNHGWLNRAATTAEQKVNCRLQVTQGINTFPMGLFNPLACNANIAMVNCSVNKLLLLLPGTAKVTVPCGMCYMYHLPLAPTTIDGLNIVEKLYVSPNHKSTLLTKFVFVQCLLGMSDTNPILKNNTSMRIVLMGDTNVTFVPASGKAGATGLTFNTGIKLFLVARGQLSVQGWTGSLDAKRAGQDLDDPDGDDQGCKAQSDPFL